VTKWNNKLLSFSQHHISGNDGKTIICFAGYKKGDDLILENTVWNC